MDKIELNSGAKKLAVFLDGEQTGEIRFNPNDLGVVERFYSAYGEITQRLSELERREQELAQNSETDENGVPVNIGKRIALSREVYEFMREKIDGIFGPGTSHTAFGDEYIVPSLLGDFLDALAPAFESARAEKMTRYTNQRLSGRVMK